MVNIIKDILPQSKIVHQPFPELLDKIDINRYVSTSKKLNQMTDWTPKISLRNGIAKTIEYYKKNLDNYL